MLYYDRLMRCAASRFARGDLGAFDRARNAFHGNPTTQRGWVEKLTAEKEEEERPSRRAAERASDVDECIRHERKLDPSIDERTAYLRAHRNMQSDLRHYSRLFEEEERKGAEEERRAAERAASPEGRREALRRATSRFRAEQADGREAAGRVRELMDSLIQDELWADPKIGREQAAVRASMRIDQHPELLERAVADLTAREEERGREELKDARLVDGPRRDDVRGHGDPHFRDR
jgi:hypothetical protein